jgi:sphingomyelin phosphodiesterase
LVLPCAAVKSGAQYGERSCDAPNALFLSMLEAINRIAGDATMAILTGDIIDHAVWLSSQPDVIEGVTSAYALMTDRLAFPVYGTIGARLYI